MEEAIAKARALIEAMEYIRQFRGRIVVVKLGGSVLDDIALQKKLLTDIAFIKPVAGGVNCRFSVLPLFAVLLFGVGQRP